MFHLNVQDNNDDV